MFFVNSRIRFFKISLVHCDKYGKTQYKKKELNQHSVCSCMLVLTLKHYPENCAFLILTILELFAREDCKFRKK